VTRKRSYPVDDPTRVRVEVELDKELVELAATAGLDLNEVAGRALKRALGVKAFSDERARRWAEDNAEAIQASNEEIRRNGLWSIRHRLF